MTNTIPPRRVTIFKHLVIVSEGIWPDIAAIYYRSTEDRDFLSVGDFATLEMVSPERLEEIKKQLTA